MLEKLFRKQTPKTELPKAAQPQAPDVPYEPSLVAALTQQHRDMVTLMVKANSAAQQGAYDEIKECLAQFKDALAVHVAQENTKLHPYLAAHIKGENSRETLRDARQNCNRVSQSVEGFIAHYSGFAVGDHNVERFGMELEGVSEEFCEEIEREEAVVYTLYLPPDAY